MSPLTAAVVGGMLSSLINILRVTPVIFTWLRERALKSQNFLTPDAGWKR